MADEPPQWAKDRVREIGREEYCAPFGTETAIAKAFARYIMQHEEPPVDPLLIEARELCDRYYPSTAGLTGPFSNGHRDQCSSVQLAFDALKRGVELARSAQP